MGRTCLNPEGPSGDKTHPDGKKDLYFSRERWGFIKWNLKSFRAVALPMVSATAALAASFHSVLFGASFPRLPTLLLLSPQLGSI